MIWESLDFFFFLMERKLYHDVMLKVSTDSTSDLQTAVKILQQEQALPGLLVHGVSMLGKTQEAVYICAKVLQGPNLLHHLLFLPHGSDSSDIPLPPQQSSFVLKMLSSKELSSIQQGRESTYWWYADRECSSLKWPSRPVSSAYLKSVIPLSLQVIS